MKHGFAVALCVMIYICAVSSVSVTAGDDLLVKNPDHSPEVIGSAASPISFYVTLTSDAERVVVRYHMCSSAGSCGPTKNLEMTRKGSDYSASANLLPSDAPLDGADGLSYWFEITIGGKPVSSSTYDAVISPSAGNPPVCRIATPWGTKGDRIGTVTFTGTASDPDAIDLITSVQVRVDDEDWVSATGTTSWRYDLTAATLDYGKHVLYARSSDVSGSWSLCDDNTETKTAFYLTGLLVTLPVSDFTHSPKRPTNSDVVHFSDASTDNGAITSWEWDLNGDGQTDSVEQNPSYKYSTSGTYTIRLSVTDSEGANDFSEKSLLIVKGEATEEELQGVNDGASEPSAHSDANGIVTLSVLIGAVAGVALYMVLRKRV
ncbi:MAG: hypothetical protein CVT48_03130 [Thermoplasmata archaeon HGW-Thermoplasmata-1]|nr:MAG: hypothetical protein CVT48_03130 [Thermoplasmata archaeon HGW-Thermoplasmata-1]